MRRKISSQYTRVTRIMRRPRDNARLIKKKTGDNSVYLEDWQLGLLAFILCGMWMIAIGAMFYLAYT